MSPAAQVAAVREFHRFYTGVVGALDEGLLRTPYSLTEARVLFELGQGPVEVAVLRRGLGLDAGYLSRILARFTADGLVGRTSSPSGGRRQVVALTDTGRTAFEMLDARSAAAIGDLLSRLGKPDRERLVAAMRTIRQLLGEPERPPGYVLRPLEPGDAGWIVHRHGVRYAQEYGWDSAFEALVARIVADYLDTREPGRENAWIAEVDGERVGCVLCVRRDDDVAQLRLLLVEPQARG